MDRLASEIATELKGSRSLVSRITGKSNIPDSNLAKIGAKIEKDETPKSVKASVKEFDLKLGKNQLKDTQLNANLKAYAQKHGIKDDLTKMDNTELAKLRLKNPKAFDETVFPQKTKNLPIVAEVMNSPEALKARAQFASSKTSSASRTDDAARINTFKEGLAKKRMLLLQDLRLSLHLNLKNKTKKNNLKVRQNLHLKNLVLSVVLMVKKY